MFVGILPLDKREFSVGEAQQPLNISWDGNSKSLYTLLMWDEDAPYPQDPKYSPLLHYLVINIPGTNIKKGNEIVSYLPPNPPKDSPSHSYTIGIYEQRSKMSNIPSIKERKRFNVKEFINKNKLQHVKEVTFSVNPSIIEVTAPIKEEMDYFGDDLDSWSSSTVAGGLPQRGRASSPKVTSRSMSPRSRVATAKASEGGKPGCGCGGGSSISFQPGSDGAGGEGPTDHIGRRSTQTKSPVKAKRSGSPRSRVSSYKKTYSSRGVSRPMSPRTKATPYRRGKVTTSKKMMPSRSMSPRSMAMPNQMNARRVYQGGQARVRTASPGRAGLPSYPRSTSPRSRGQNYKKDIAKSCAGKVPENKMKSYSCSIDVANKNDESCSKKDWGTRKGCVNPWAVCAKSTGTSMGRSNEVSKCLDFDNMTLERLRGYAKLHGLQIPENANKPTVLAKIKSWKLKEKL